MLENAQQKLHSRPDDSMSSRTYLKGIKKGPICFSQITFESGHCMGKLISSNNA